MDIIEQLSAALADRVGAAAPAAAAIKAGPRHRSGILWRPDVLVTAEQEVTNPDSAHVILAGTRVVATLAGRDQTTDIAVFRLETPLPGALPVCGEMPRVGSLAMVVGASATGTATGRLAMVHATGPAWHSMEGGLIDSLIRLDVRLGADEGGLVLDHAGAFLGMAVAGPRRRGLVIPAATLARVVEQLLADGHIPRGWLGVGLQSVPIASKYRGEAGQARGAMVLQVVEHAPADRGGVLQGDILLAVDGHRFGQGRRVFSLMGPERIGQAVPVRLLRGDSVRTVTVTIKSRPPV